MADYHLVIRGGEIHDGLGNPGVVGDVAISGDRIVAVGTVTGSGAQEIDARGKLVTRPGTGLPRWLWAIAVSVLHRASPTNTRCLSA